jgi:cytochrome c1
MARSAASDEIARGRAAIGALGCGSCHHIDGVANADGTVGPSLNGIGARAILAGELPNTPDNMRRWIANPQAIQPGIAMPPFANVPDSVLRDIVAYLRTLR